MVQVTAFTKLNGQGAPTFDAMSSPPPMSNRVPAELVGKKESEWICAADAMASDMIQRSFDQQNEMLLRIQHRLIRDRADRLESIEKHLYQVQADLETARMALNSISN